MTGIAGALVSIVLVHGGFVDGSGWEGVHQILKKDGYAVTVMHDRRPHDALHRRNFALATLAGQRRGLCGAAADADLAPGIRIP
jgi:hypothetical protein